jgi:glycosyltransferase involved in cell wall biosynthesis
MEALGRGPRIVYHGMVGARDLARAVAAAGFYVYPCTIAEISSISLMRAQAMGAIPITSRHINSALPETSGIYDLGPPARPGLISDDEEWQNDFVNAVIRAVKAPRSEMDSHRRVPFHLLVFCCFVKCWFQLFLCESHSLLTSIRTKMKSWARETFDWDRVAAQWHGVFQKHLGARPERLDQGAADSVAVEDL